MSVVLDAGPHENRGRPKRRGSNLWKVVKVMALLAVGSFAVSTFADYMHRPEVLVASYPTQPTASAQHDAMEFIRQVTATMRSCDGAADAMETAVAGNNHLEKLQAARNVAPVCRAVTDDLYKTEVPRSVGHTVALAFAKARPACALAAISRSLSADALESGLSESGTFQRLFVMSNEEYLTRSRQEADSAHYWHRQCMVELVTNAGLLGIKPEELT